MEQITDVEAKGYYQELLEKKSPEEALRIVVAGTREHCRVLLPWNEKKPDYHKGLTQSVNEKMTDVYRELIALRKCEKALVYGNFEVLDKKKNRFVYKRTLEGTEFVIDCNLGETEQRAYTKSHEFTQVFPMTASDNKLAAYEARIYKKG